MSSATRSTGDSSQKRAHNRLVCVWGGWGRSKEFFWQYSLTAVLGILGIIRGHVVSGGPLVVGIWCSAVFMGLYVA